jgi:hypothetical protein
MGWRVKTGVTDSCGSTYVGLLVRQVHLYSELRKVFKPWYVASVSSLPAQQAK